MPNLTRNDPVSDLMNDFFNGFLVRPVGYAAQADADRVVRRMRIDVAEQGNEYRVHADLPGVKKEDIHVEIDGEQVTITAESRSAREEKDGERVLHSERYVGKVARTFRLGEELDESKAVAKFNDGVLELTLPKKATVAARRISVQ